jgi:hypothetical protein
MPGTALPQVTVEIRGADRTGKSVVAQVLREALRRELVTVICADPYARRPAEVLRASLVDLKARGLLVEIVETETAGPIHPKVPIEARGGMRPLLTDGGRSGRPMSSLESAVVAAILFGFACGCILVLAAFDLAIAIFCGLADDIAAARHRRLVRQADRRLHGGA